MRIRVTGINTVRKRLADGTVNIHRYHRATGMRIEGEPGSPEFLRSYAAAEKTMQDRHAGTFAGLVRDYLLSREFDKRADSTKAEYRRMLTKAEAKFGTLPFEALADPAVRKQFLRWHETVAATSGEREADNRLSVISAVLTWGLNHVDGVNHNYLSGFKRLHTVDRSELIWLPEHVHAFMRVAPIEMQRALILAMHTGQRQGDILKLTWGNVVGTDIDLRQGKRGRHVVIPCTKALRRMLDGLDRNTLVVLTTKTGRPWRPRWFKAQWDAAAKKAGITDLHFHDLRGTAVTMLAEAGCTPPMIAAITGHSLKTVTTILDRYLARTRVLAGEAIALFENAKSTRFANRLQTDTPKPAKGKAK